MHRKVGRLILFIYSGEREGQIGSWPTAQAETSNLCQVCRKSGNPAFKGPETLDTTLDSLHKKKSHLQTCLLRLPGGDYIPPDNRPSNQLNTNKCNINKKDDYVLYGWCSTRRTPTMNTQVQLYLKEPPQNENDLPR